MTLAPIGLCPQLLGHLSGQGPAAKGGLNGGHFRVCLRKDLWVGSVLGRQRKPSGIAIIVIDG
jgi:hypothetical protein